MSDSGTLSEESSILHFARVLIRTSTERPEVLDKGTLVIGGLKIKDLEQAVELAVSMKEEPIVVAEDYTDRNVSVMVIKLSKAIRIS